MSKFAQMKNKHYYQHLKHLIMEKSKRFNQAFILSVLIAAHILTFSWVAATFCLWTALKMFAVPYIWAFMCCILYKITFK